MSYLVTKYPHGTFSWADFFSTDIAASKKFLTGLFGWTAEDMPTEPGKPDYTMFSLDGHYVAGGSPTFDAIMPSFWNSYVSVDNVDAIIEKTKELGGKVMMPAMDVFDSGRMATIQDPMGASISFWQPKKHIGAGIVNTFGAMCWNELYTTDVAKAKQFYGALLGWTFDENTEPGYVTIKNKGRMNGGIFPITPEMKNTQPNWTVQFTVGNIEEAIKKVKKLGGHVYTEPVERTFGTEKLKIAVIGDPAHTRFMIEEMSEPQVEWKE